MKNKEILNRLLEIAEENEERRITKRENLNEFICTVGVFLIGAIMGILIYAMCCDLIM